MTQGCVLVGFMGAGKSTIARLLSHALDLDGRDLDTEIEQLSNCTIPQIFEREGEAGFRKWETKALQQLMSQKPLVLATGGGVVTTPENWPLMRNLGKIVALTIPFETVISRVKGGEGRPLAKDQQAMKMLFEQRQPLYNMADYVVDCNDRSPMDIVNKICKLLSQ